MRPFNIPINLVLALIMLILANPSVEAYPNGKEHEWLPTDITDSQKAKIFEILEHEHISVPTLEDHDGVLGFLGNPSSIDYGYSWSASDELRQSVLREVNRRAHMLGRRPRVLDLGAGRGLMAWKLILAGANYTGLESQKRSVEDLVRRLDQAKEFLKPGETLKTVSKVITGDLSRWVDLISKNPALKPEPFDIIFMGDFLHFLTPEQINQAMPILASLLAPGGELFIIADSPSLFSRGIPSWPKSGRIVEVFFQNRANGYEFPGSLIMNILNPGELNFVEESGDIISLHYGDRTFQEGCHSSHPLVQAQPTLPGETRLGHIGVPEPATLMASCCSQSPAKKIGNGRVVMSFVSATKRAFHVFDSAILTQVMQNAGLTVVDAYYTTDEGHRAEPSPSSQADFKTQVYKAAIRAVKPL